MSDQPAQRSSQRLDLAAALGFSAEDLIANQAGRLTGAQQERIRRASRRFLLIGVAGIVVIGLGAAVLIFLGQQNNSAVLYLIGLVLTIVNAAIVGLLVQNYLRAQSDLAQPPRAEKGIINRTLRISGRTPTYTLRIGDQQIIVNKPTFNAFIDGAVYTLYRSAGSKALLSAEMIGMVDD